MTPQIARIRMALEDLKPYIWRRVEVSLTTNLRSLHEVIQAAMPWESRHLYHFTVGDRIYGEPDPEDATWGRKIYQAKSMRLGTLIGRGVSEFVYTYDFGDDWGHRITVEIIEAPDPALDYPVFIDGERRAPPEDVGGPPGFMDFLEAISRRAHPRHKDMARWYGGPFHQTDFAAADIAASVRAIAERRKLALKAFQRSREMRQR